VGRSGRRRLSCIPASSSGALEAFVRRRLVSRWGAIGGVSVKTPSLGAPRPSRRRRCLALVESVSASEQQLREGIDDYQIEVRLSVCRSVCLSGGRSADLRLWDPFLNRLGWAASKKIGL
jgi:hypothetical protein